MEVQPFFIQDVMSEIVEAVSEKLTPYLSTIDPGITGVHYQYGHPLEIINTMVQYTQGDKSRFEKYPLVALFLDIEIDRDVDPSLYGSANLDIVIINGTDPNYTAQQRDVNNFKPILTPIYMELMKQISYRGDVFLFSNGIDSIPHKMTNRYYWGKQGLFGNMTNIFNDWIDAIEIKKLKVDINSNYCPKLAI